jgi:hypothetical protein
MPFENHVDLSFTATSIAKNAPPASGVYGLADACRWIYIGGTADIQAELLRHLDSGGRRQAAFIWPCDYEKPRLLLAMPQWSRTHGQSQGWRLQEGGKRMPFCANNRNR